MTAAEAKFYRDGLEAQIDLGSSYLPTHLWYITDTVDETKSCMWLCILTTSIVAFSCFFTISTVAEVCASAVWLKGIFVFRDLGISWGYKWRTRFVSFMFRTRWASGHLGVASVQDDWDAGCRDVLWLSDLDRWNVQIPYYWNSTFNYMTICSYIFKLFKRIIKLAIMVGMDVHSSSPLPS